MQDPISKIEWRKADTLKANAYNPNVVFTPELRLLERSILQTGWVQPILITDDGTIIDGFHRWRLSLDSIPLRDRYDSMVPCAILDVSPGDAMLLTVRMNRAKGTHLAVRMSSLVRQLLDVYNYPPEQIALEIGATKEEVELLSQENIFKARNLKEYKYSKAWYPEKLVNGKKI